MQTSIPALADRTCPAGLNARDAHAVESTTLGAAKCLLGRNTVYNLLGSVIPGIAAVLAIPRIVAALGSEKFGVLSLLWALVGYFSVFDFGLGRALTKLAAERRARGDGEGVREIFWATSWFLVLSASIVATVVMTAVAVTDTSRFGWKQDIRVCLYISGALLPAVLASAAFRGFLEAYERFDAINVIRTVTGAGTFLGPLAAMNFGPPLPMAVGAMAVMRIASTVSFLLLSIRLVPGLRASCRVRAGSLRPLLRLGGWMTVSNVVSPVMTYLDRFLVGGLLPFRSVAFYTAPFDAVTKLLLIPTALAGVLFPRFSSLSALRPARAAAVHVRALAATFSVMLVPTLAAIFCARTGLRLWLGAEFAEQSALVLQVLAIGVMVNGLGAVSYALVQGFGRPDLTAKLHLLEVPVYVIACLGLTACFGIQGTALAWTLRVFLDTAALFYLAQRLLRQSLAAREPA